MIFLTFDLNTMTTTTAKQIAQHILDNKQARPYLSDTQLSQLKAILTPSIKPDDDNIKHLCRELVDTLEVCNEKGEKLRFHRDEQKGVLYFGDDAGWKMAQQFHDHNKPLSTPYRGD